MSEKIDFPYSQAAVYVYEAPLRLWHWVNALAITLLSITGYFIGSPLPTMPGEASEHFLMGYIRFVHFASGYVLAVGLLFRIYWAFVGNHHARQLFLPPVFDKVFWSGVIHEAKWYAFLAKEPRKYIGHNPLATLGIRPTQCRAAPSNVQALDLARLRRRQKRVSVSGRRRVAMGAPAELSQRLEQVFERIHQTRMRDVPVLNPALQVAAVGFQPWRGQWLGVMVTPWFMNLMLLPQAHEWEGLEAGGKQIQAFPSGEYEFVLGVEPEIGKYQSCSLFSPMFQFEDHEAAVATARACLAALMLAASREALGSEPQAEDDTRGVDMEASISRRDFLRGGFLRCRAQGERRDA